MGTETIDPVDGVEPGRQLGHIGALDGLRGVAVAGVLLFHGGHLTGGYLGVDLFFVLSGFLITSLLLAECERTGRVALGGFWARRARRLLPALGGMLVGVAVYAAVFAHPAELGGIRGDALATLGYVANWRDVFARQDYWSLFRAPSPLQHTWSLAIEEQFYLVWPLVVLAVALAWKRVTATAVLVTSVVLAAVSGVLTAVLYDAANVSRVYYGTDTRAAAILLGAAFAAFRAVHGPAGRHATRIAVEIAGVGGAVVLAVAWVHLDGRSAWLYRGGFLLCTVAAVAVIAAATQPDRLVVARALELRPLELLGLVSYGVYLWHWPVYLVLDRRRTGIDGWSLVALRVAVTCAIAAVSYVAVERPIRRGALTALHWRALAPLGAAGLLALTLAVTAGGEPAVATPSRPATSWSTTTTGTPGTASTPRRVRVLVVGDSVAVSLMPGLQQAEAAAHLEVVLGASVGCDSSGHRHAFDGTPPPTTPCPPSWGRLVDDLRPDVVLMVDSGVWTLRDEHVGGRTLRLGTPEWDAYRIAVWQQSVELFSARGAHVVMPTIAFVRPPDTRNTGASVQNPAAVDRADADLATLATRDVGRVTLVDLRAHVCPRGRFQEGLDGVDQLRPDGVHYGPAGSRVVGRWLAPLLAEAGGRAPASTAR